MRINRKSLACLGAVVWAAAILGSVASAQAQRSGGGVTGEARLHPGTWGNQRASRNVRHARDYARGIYDHSRYAGTIPTEVARTDSEELGRNISRARQELKTAQKEVGQDPAAAATLTTIDEHLVTAAKEHAMLHEQCCKDSVDGTACMEHCSRILLELDKAQAEHDALLRTMEIQQRQQQ